MTVALINLCLTLALCYAAWGLFHARLYRRGFNFGDGYLWTTAYFLGVAGVLGIIFWPYLSLLLLTYEVTPLLVLAVMLGLVFLTHVLLPKYVQEPTAYFTQYPNRYYLKLGWQRVIAKSAEIFAQQVFIAVLVMLLYELGLTLPQLIAAFCVLFAFLHIPLLVLERGKWPMWAFLGAVIAFSIVFPYLILYVPYGFAYNIAIHWLFYTTMATTFWLWHAHTSNTT